MSFATIFFDFLKIPAGKLVGSCQDDRLTVSRLSFSFFLRSGGFFFFVGLLAFSATNIYLSDVGRGLKCGLGLGLNSLVKRFVLEVQLLVPTIYPGLYRWPQAFSKASD